MRRVPAADRACHDGQDHVDHRAAERLLDRAHFREREIQARESPGAAGLLFQWRVAVEAQRLDDRFHRRHGL
jgi:hypothetical protein